MKHRYLAASFVLAFACLSAHAATVRVIADRPDAIYRVGETATFSITVSPPDALKRVPYQLSLDGGRELGKREAELVEGNASVSGTLDEPGILRCTLLVAKVHRGRGRRAPMAAAAFDPFEIRATAAMPEDFGEFWRAQKAELAKVPMDARLESVDDRDPDIDLVKITLANVRGTRVHGYFAKPKHDRPFPAILALPHAGVYSITPDWVTADAARGFLAMAISAHDIPNGQPKSFYAKLKAGKLRRYAFLGRAERETYYFRRVFLGCVRAVDYLASRPEWDRKHLIVNGVSQGGGLSLVTAGLDSRVTAIAANVPALCDHRGPAFGRPAGWPKLVPRNESGSPAAVLAASAYYDACNFARLYKGPAIMGVGLIDTTCPPITVFAAYNLLAGPKKIDVEPLMGHSARSKSYARLKEQWILKQAGLAE